MTAYLSEKVPVARGIVFLASFILILEGLTSLFNLLTAFSRGLMGSDL